MNRLFSLWYFMKFLTEFETDRQTCIFQETNYRFEQFHRYFPDNEYVFPYLEGRKVLPVLYCNLGNGYE